MAMHSVGLHERHRGGDAAEELEIALGRFMRRHGRGAVPVASGSVAVSRGALEQPGEAGKARHEVAVATLEESAPLRRDCLWILEVFVEEQTRVTGVQAVDVVHGHALLL
jgi:hypothetical protein